MASLSDMVTYCDARLRTQAIADFPGALNGLQFANSGKVTKLAASVDAGLTPIRRAIEAKADLLLVHHGLFWSPPRPITGSSHEKIRDLVLGDCAVYSSHLPLDCHPELGNNALLAKALGLAVCEWFLPFQGTPIAAIAESGMSRSELRQRLQGLFPQTFRAIEFGSDRPQRLALCTGSGGEALPALREQGIDTLITGELRQHHFNLADELSLNLYPCGHYATETFGVKALAQELGTRFDLPWVFVDTACPL